jgi:hypothetical protein
MKLKYLLLPLFLLVTGCSSTHQIAIAETHQAAALGKVTLASRNKDKAQKAKDGEIANLTQSVKFLLSLPPSPKTIPVANQLLDASLSLTGAPSEREGILEGEVQDLIASNSKNEKENAKMQSDIAKIKSDLDDSNKKLDTANQQVSKTTVTLYQDALKIASDDDSKATIFHLMIWTGVFVVVMVLLRIFFTMTTTGATIAAKLP